MGNVVRVKFAGRTDRYPTADEVRAGTSVTPAPFTRSYATLTAGQTEYVGALGYDAAGNESGLALSSVTAPGTVSPTPYAMFLRGRGVRTGAFGDHPLSVSGTSAASNGDLVSVWEDQTGNGRHLWGGWNFNTLSYQSSAAPTLDGNEIHCGVNPVGTVGFLAARLQGATNTCWWSQISSGEIQVLIGFRAASSPPLANGGNALWQARAAGDGTGAIRFPDTTGHIVDRAFSNQAQDEGDVAATTDLTQRTVYSVAGGGPSASRYVSQFVAKINGTQVFANNESGAGSSFPYMTGDFLIGRDVASAGNEIFIGWVSDVIVFDHILTDEQEAAWTPYLLGATDTPPTEAATPTLSYVYAGGDVIVTVESALADSAKIDASLSATPSDATVRATTAIAPAPFSKTFASPTGTDVLHVKAFAYVGSSESASATVDIPAQVGDAAADADFVMWATSTALANARVLANSTTITWSTATAGLIKGTVVNANPSTIALGDMFYASSTNTVAVVTGNQATTTMVLTQTGTGAGSAAPIWVTMPTGGVNALSSMSDVALTTLTDGQVLTYSTASAVWHNATPSTSGGAAFVHPDSPPAVANAADDEFEFGSSIDTTGGRRTGATAWTGVNATNISTAITDGGLVMTLSSTGVTQRGWTQPVSGTAWKYRCKVTADGKIDSTTGEVGMWLYESGTGKLLVHVVGFSGGPNLVFTQRWTNTTTFGATIATYTLPESVAGQPFYLEIELSGSNYIVRWSYTGRRFKNLATIATTTPFTTAADQIGIKMYSDNAGNDHAAVFEWFRKVA